MLLANSSRNPVNRKMRQRLVLSRSIVVLITETSESVLFVWPLRLWSLANHKQEVVVLWKCTGPHFIDFKTKACGPVKIWIFGHQPGLWTWLFAVQELGKQVFPQRASLRPSMLVDLYGWPVQLTCTGQPPYRYVWPRPKLLLERLHQTNTQYSRKHESFTKHFYFFLSQVALPIAKDMGALLKVPYAPTQLFHSSEWLHWKNVRKSGGKKSR